MDICSTIRRRWNIIAGRCYILCGVPKQFYQLFNIFLEYKSCSLPAIHILMSRKTGTLYSQVVGEIKELLPITVIGIITDYEHAYTVLYHQDF